MPPVPLPVVVLRAPLLPLSALRDPVAALRRHPLGAAAVGLASPDLAAALSASRAPAAAQASLARYARRAAFRPTPAGLLAGVTTAALGPRTRVATAGARAHVGPTWQAVAALGQALLDQPAIRAHVRLRAAPSLLRGPETATWLAFDSHGSDAERGGGLADRSVELDPVMAAVLDAAAAPAPWGDVRAALVAALRDDPLSEPRGQRLDDPDEDNLDAHLFLLLDQGLLVHDLLPPLVGEPPGRWLQQRLDRLPAELAPLLDPSRAALAAWSSNQPAGDQTAVLQIETRGRPTIDRRAIDRACAVAPLLFGLQQALAAPVAERALDAELHARLAALIEWQGAGAYDLTALASGRHGLDLGPRLEDAGEVSAPAPAPPPAVVALLAEAATEAARAGRLHIDLDPDKVAEALEGVPPVKPPTFELMLTPMTEAPRQPPGTGWLLGLHAPAGASVGRVAGALGEGGSRLLRELAAAEAEARPDEEALDVAYAASPSLADLSQHPRARQRVLALIGWAEADALTPADLRLVVDPGAPEPLGLQHQGRAVAPAGLHRVRSTTAPPGLYQLLLGWSFARQHRPWALSWGPLAHLTFLPRLALAGFVIAPASWRIPDTAACRRPAALVRWRRQHRVPAQIQVGEGDELLLIDLDARGAAAELTRFAGQRAHEVWPPLRRPVDAGGRRLEVVVPVVDRAAGADLDARAAAIGAIARAVRVPPPAELPASQWTSFRLYGTEQGQDAVLHEAVAPLINEARAAGELDRWFFLRYLAPGDPRPHLRLRVHAPGGAAGFQRRLEVALAPLRERGDLVAVEVGPYLPETARYGGSEGLAAAEAIFQSDSELVLALLAAESEGLDPDSDRAERLVLAHDALARGLGLDMGERLDLAEGRRWAAAGGRPEPADWPALFRIRGRHLQAALAGNLPPSLKSALAAFEAAVRTAAPTPARWRALLPALLHLQSVRLLGPHPAGEQLSYVFWARALEGLVRRGLGDPPQPPLAAEA